MKHLSLFRKEAELAHVHFVTKELDFHRYGTRIKGRHSAFLTRIHSIEFWNVCDAFERCFEECHLDAPFVSRNRKRFPRDLVNIHEILFPTLSFSKNLQFDFQLRIPAKSRRIDSLRTSRSVNTQRFRRVATSFKLTASSRSSGEDIANKFAARKDGMKTKQRLSKQMLHDCGSIDRGSQFISSGDFLCRAGPT